MPVIYYKLVHQCANYALKLNFLVHSIAACQKCRAIFKNYKLLAEPVYLYVIYALTLHVQVRSLRLIKDVKLLLQSRPRPKKQKLYENQTDQRQKINLFSSAFVSICVFLHFLPHSSLLDN